MLSSNSKDTLLVADFYTGKSIFVTGGTGFLGKLLIEKILWSCPGVPAIYLLIRSKKNQDEKSRLATILRSSVFERLKNSRPNDLKKIIPILGDLSKKNMDICQTDKTTLINNVSVVFHVAATVRFDEPIKQAITVNSVGTFNMLEFCLQMHNIKAFIYISTAFSNCNREEVKEEIYNLPYDPDKLISVMEVLSDDILEEIIPKLFDKLPNTYTYTKALAENVIQKYHTKLPIAIVRPSIVLSSIQEPVPGWTDSWYGPTLFVTGILKGIHHVATGNCSTVAHIIPVDMVINLIICAAWRVANSSGTSSIEVYHCCSGKRNPITWAEFIKYCTNSATQKPVEQLLSYPHLSWQSNKILYLLQMFFLEKIPAYGIDCINYLIGKKPILMKFHKKILKAHDLTAYFRAQQWKFLDDNTQNLSNLLHESEREIFSFDVRSIHWPTYLQNYCLGIRHYLLNNSPDSLPECQKRLAMLKWIYVWIPWLLFLSTLYLVFVS